MTSQPITAYSVSKRQEMLYDRLRDLERLRAKVEQLNGTGMKKGVRYNLDGLKPSGWSQSGDTTGHNVGGTYKEQTQAANSEFSATD